jgi:cell division cycle protein 20 (cofactor of APC complex)
MNVEMCRRVLLSEEKRDEETYNTTAESCRTPAETSLQKEYKRQMLSSLCGVPLEMIDDDAQPRALFRYGGNETTPASPPSQHLRRIDPYSLDHLRVLQRIETSNSSSAVLMKSPETERRKIPTIPSRTLDAPGIIDNYYLNLISWGKNNVLAVILRNTVYLWNANTEIVQILTTIEGAGNYGTSVAWCTIPDKTHLLAVGTNGHKVQIWDTERGCMIRAFFGHFGRVGSLAWSQRGVLSSGGKDGAILQHDLRSPANFESAYKGHKAEVCGLTWNEEGSALASGGNDDAVCIWDVSMSSYWQRRRPDFAVSTEVQIVRPRLVLREHKSAVKALGWCPFRRGVLASGGGSADQTIKLWHSFNGTLLSSIDTGSQVSSLVWSKYQRELCSGHGYSKNPVVLWKCGSGSNLTKVQEMAGHTARVLNIACSPDGRKVVSASADETLCFWDIFGEPPRSSFGTMAEMSKLTFGGPTIR